MSYTPISEHMSLLGFASPETEKAAFRVWTNQAGSRQLRAYRSTSSTWLDYYERTDPAAPWRKQAADPSPATEQEFRHQLMALGWVVMPAHYLPIPGRALYGSQASHW